METTRTEQVWLDSVRAAVLRGEVAVAHTALIQALAEHPDSTDLQRAHAGILQQTGQADAAEEILRDLLSRNPGDTGAAFALAGTLREQGRTAAAARMVRACMDAQSNLANPECAIAAVELLDDMERRADAAAIAEAAIVATPGDARLHAYAGMLAIQMGEFERARERYLFALQHDPRALEWHVAIGLASTMRYADAAHPDFERFCKGLTHADISPLARAELNFALGKAFDDVGDYAEAVTHFREGNAIRHREAKWSAKAWRRLTTARLGVRRPHVTAPCTEHFIPIFVVGMPRTGTTLLAELLSRFPGVCNRGELNALAQLAQQPTLADTPDCAAIQRAASTYSTRSRQDDAPDGRWFIDKQPLNFRYLDLALTLFPDAKVIHCQRNPRDNALSLWMQCFLEDVQGYAYDFGDMALVMRDERRLMEHWRKLWPDSIRAVRYEDLVTDPVATLAALAAWIGLPAAALSDEDTHPASTISTASLWQARQPVNTRSIGRWKKYAERVPELLKFNE